MIVNKLLSLVLLVRQRKVMLFDSRSSIMNARLVRTSVLWLLLSTPALFAQKLPEGLWQGYDGEWRHVSEQLIALAEATPPEKFAWRPAAGVRSTSEVYMHIVLANFYLLGKTGPKIPADLKDDAEKTVTSKAEVIDWLKRSLAAVKEAHLTVKAAELQRKSYLRPRCDSGWHVSPDHRSR